jgi:hypothetical protein
LERRLARCERKSRRGEGDEGPFFYLLQGDDPDPDLSAGTRPVFIMDLRDKPAAAAPKAGVTPSASAA